MSVVDCRKKQRALKERGEVYLILFLGMSVHTIKIK